MRRKSLPRVGPNPRRQFLWALVALLSVAVGYGANFLFRDTGKPPPATDVAEVSKGKPWYLDQSAPPSLVTAPDASIFPDSVNGDEGDPVRPYEEALPEEIYEPPPSRPVLTPPPRPAAAIPPPPPKPAPPTKPASRATAPEEVAALPPSPVVPTPPVEEPGAEPAWRQFAMAAPNIGGRPMIALVIDDMGVDRKRSAQAVAFEKPLTLSYLSYARGLERQAAAARAAGHELLLHVPMEPKNRNLDAGPEVLLVDLKPDEMRRRLRWGLDRFASFVGVNNHMGSRFTADAVAMTLVMEELKRRGLLFLDSRTTGSTVGLAVARRIGVPTAERNIFLDNENTVEAVNARLRDLEKFARRNGHAIAIAHPRDATLKALTPWLREVEGRGFVLVPLTTVIRALRTAG
jgi:uncharacterized protein